MNTKGEHLSAHPGVAISSHAPKLGFEPRAAANSSAGAHLEQVSFKLPSTVFYDFNALHSLRHIRDLYLQYAVLIIRRSAVVEGSRIGGCDHVGNHLLLVELINSFLSMILLTSVLKHRCS